MTNKEILRSSLRMGASIKSNRFRQYNREFSKLVTMKYSNDPEMKKLGEVMLEEWYNQEFKEEEDDI